MWSCNLCVSCFFSQSSLSVHVCLRWMEWTSTKQNIILQWRLFVALVLQFPCRCYGNVWWNRRTPSRPHHWGLRTTTSHGRDGAVASPSTWRPVSAGLGTGYPPVWCEMTKGWDSASQGAKGPHPIAQETRWDPQNIWRLRVSHMMIRWRDERKVWPLTLIFCPTCWFLCTLWVQVVRPPWLNPILLFLRTLLYSNIRSVIIQYVCKTLLNSQIYVEFIPLILH